MTDSEDFLSQINIEELYPQEGTSSKPKKRKLSGKKKKKDKKMKIKFSPNCFIGFQIYDSIIRQRVADFQNKIIEKNPLLKKALIDLRTLHVTLAVTQLKNKARVKELQERLEVWSEKDMKFHFITPINLTFEGVDNFGGGITFVKINECKNRERLCNLASAVNNLLLESGFQTENKKFIPHLTVMKLSRNYKLFKDKKSFSDDFKEFSQCQNKFGNQVINELQLLSMTDKKDDNGYYKCLWRRRTDESQLSLVAIGSTE